MKKVADNQALAQAYENLYNSSQKQIDKNLITLIKIKKHMAFASKPGNKKRH